MMNRINIKNIFLFFALLALLSVNILFPAAAYGQTRKLGLEEARELALSNSRSLARYNLNIQSSVLDEKTQNYDYLPSLELSAGTTLWDLKEGTSGDFVKNNFYARASAGFSLGLWDGGKKSIQRAIAGLSTESARQDALSEYYSVLDSADSAFYAVLKAAAGLEAAESSLETANLSLSTAEIRRQGGMMSEADYLKALSEKESRETSRNQSRRDLSLAKLRLNNLLGIKEQIELEPVDFDSLENLILALAGIDDEGFEKLLSRFRENARGKNPGIVRAELSSSITEKNLSLAKRDYSPTLNASLSAGLDYKIDAGIEPSSSLSVGITIPLEFWMTAANVEKRKIALTQSAMDYDSAVETFEIEIQVCLLDIISQAGQIVSSEKAMEYAAMNFDHVLELYRLGQNSQPALSDAEVLLRTNRNQFIAARYAFLLSLSGLRSIGAFEAGEEINGLLSELGLR